MIGFFYYSISHCPNQASAIHYLASQSRKESKNCNNQVHTRTKKMRSDEYFIKGAGVA